MPAKIFPGAKKDYLVSCVDLAGRKFVKTGAYRPPKAGEFFLSAFRDSVAVQATSDMHGPFYILREATPEESNCPACGQALPFADRP